MRRWGPIAGIVAVIAIVVGVIVVAGGGDDDDDGDTSAETTAATASDDGGAGDEQRREQRHDGPEPDRPTGHRGTAAAASGDITYPLTFSQAAAAGIEGDIEWGERCDTERGRLAFPDYFAPECYAPFEGDNGGATSPGVTDDTIKLVWYLAPEQDPIINYITDAIAGDDTNDQRIETMENVVRFYHTYYELYGRRIELIPFEGSGFAVDEVAARADAVRIAEEIQPFAVLSGPALTTAFSDELAARKVMCIVCGPTQPTSYYADRDPYAWAIDDNAEQKQDHVVEFVQKQLAGKNAEFAGEALAGSTAHVRAGVPVQRAVVGRAGRPLRRPDGGRRCAARRDDPVRARSDDDPADRAADDHPAEDGRRDDGAVPRRPGRATRLHPGGDRPGLLPGVGARRGHADRHPGVRAHVRPGAVAARVRRHVAQRAARADGRRLRGAVRVVQRHHGRRPTSPSPPTR